MVIRSVHCPQTSRPGEILRSLEGAAIIQCSLSRAHPGTAERQVTFFPLGSCACALAGGLTLFSRSLFVASLRLSWAHPSSVHAQVMVSSLVHGDSTGFRCISAKIAEKFNLAFR